VTDSAVPDPELLDFAHRMFELARAGSTDLLAAVDAGVPAGLTDASGNSLLMLAAYHGHAHLVDGLAERGAAINSPNDRGQTPLAGAVFKGSVDVIAVLVRHGADADAGSPSARATAAFFARDDLAALLPLHSPGDANAD
jgi:ankyrin repeat protein